MPNWCLNKILIKVPTNQLLKKLREALNSEEDFFSKLIPRPPEISENQNNSEWEIANWGVKWDATPQDIFWPDKSTVNFEILTAWVPPIAFYENMERMGYLVNGYYLEELTGLLGVYYEGNNDTYDYRNLSADEMENQLPEWVNQLFSLIDNSKIQEQAVDEDIDLEQGLEDLKKEFDELVKAETAIPSKKSKN